ncbi:hypothetical protein B0H14DRAFT_2991231 [Mycena olivaceomarginata]|nr:hypothetical protein B0H14DRAFT_2991231 [Mycena olivaceomarginata]
MPTASVPSTLRLHTLRVSGDRKILVPLGAWFVPQGALAALHTLVLDVTHLTDDHNAPDARPALVLAAAPSLRELTLQLDPPMPLDPVEAGSVPELSFDHSMRCEDLLAVPAATLLGFNADGVEGEARSRHHPHPHLRTVAFTGYQKRAATECGRMQDSGADELLEHFSRTVRERLPGLMRRGVLVVGR